MNKLNIPQLDLKEMRRYIVPIHGDGWMFIAIFALASVGLGAMIHDVMLYVGLLATAWCAYFFRDPPRIIPTRTDVIVSAADGIVDSIVTVPAPKEMGLGDGDYIRISTLLGPMDVHVNRTPIAGTVVGLKYHKGTFLNATLEKAHEDNERQYIGIKGAEVSVGVVQIAGLISRRIVCTLKENQTVYCGERFGIIRFGSRVDVFIPATLTPLVVKGQRVVGGETILAQFTAPAQ